MLFSGPRRRGLLWTLRSNLKLGGAGIGMMPAPFFRILFALLKTLLPAAQRGAAMYIKTHSLLAQAAHMLRQAKRIVCLTGSGVSAESGVATFRNAENGLWSRFDPQRLASQEGFAANPGLVWQWYMHRLTAVEQAEPNAGHRALAELEQRAPHFTLVTQNVDDLHERGGSRHVLHLHGRINRFRCNVCGFDHDLLPAEHRATLPPRCLACGGVVRPDVVWFGEPLPARLLDKAWQASERCDLFLVVGTSGLVYPAAHLPLLARQRGARVIDVNPEVTSISEQADVHLAGRSGALLPQLLAQLATELAQ
jgi:NAD-dependent deacetylase